MTEAVELITTPTGKWLESAMRGCRQLTVSSPFVTSEMVAIVERAGPDARCRLLTRTVLDDFRAHASDLDTLERLHAAGVAMKTHPLLHAKAYVVDSSVALVTSANATAHGMKINLECGLAVRDAALVRRIESAAWSGFGAPDEPSVVTSAFLRLLRTLLEAMPPAERDAARPRPGEEPSLVEIPELDRFLDGMKGWMRLTFESILRLARPRFTLRELNKLAVPLGRKRYPANKHVEEKIRQQLQQLRDLGLVRFVRPGSYEMLLRSEKEP